MINYLVVHNSATKLPRGSTSASRSRVSFLFAPIPVMNLLQVTYARYGTPRMVVSIQLRFAGRFTDGRGEPRVRYS